MAEHAELQILRAAKAAIETGGGYVVHLNRTSAFGSRDQLPAVVIHYGEDGVDFQNAHYVDSTMELVIELVTADLDPSSTGVTQWMSSARRDIHARLRANRTLGLPIVIDVLPTGANEPESEAGDIPVVRRRLRWAVKYRTRVSDATQL